MTVCALLGAPTAMAQATPPAEEAPAEQAIIVTGIRHSLETAQEIKRTADTVVDSITSQDIGALPDRSVTEALQRVPGVSINRFAGSSDPDHFSVEGSGVQIRGLTFVRSEFNGRDAFAAGSYGQALGFADVPSELLGTVEVFKNSTADQIEGGLAGTVNLITRKPFDKKGFHVAFDIEANYGDMRKKWTPTGSLLISKTWDTEVGTFGILADASYSRIRSRSDGLQIANFQTRDGATITLPNSSNTIVRTALPGTTFDASGNAIPKAVAYAPLGGQFRTQEYDRVRQGEAVAFQFKSNDNKFLLTAQYLRSHSTNQWNERTFEAGSDLSEYNTFPQGCNASGQCAQGKFQNYTYDSTNLFQSGYITLPGGAWRGASVGQGNGVTAGGMQHNAVTRGVKDEITNQDFGLNAQIDFDDHWHLDLDFDYTKSDKRNLDVSLIGGQFADQFVDLTGRYPTVIAHKPNDLAYSWATPSAALAAQTDAQYFADPKNQFWRAAMDHMEHSNGSEYAVRADLAYKFDDGSFLKSLRVGARYADRTQVVRYSSYNWGMLSETWSGSNPVSVANVGGSNVSFYDFPNFFRGQTPGPVGGWYYNGDMINDYAGMAAFAGAIQKYGITNYGTSPTWRPMFSRTGVNAEGFLPSEVQPIAQRDFNAYVRANFGADDPIFGNVRLSGNVGVRFVRTGVSSSGSIGVPSRTILNIDQPYATRCAPQVPPGAPPGTPPLPLGGVCNLSAADYAKLQTWAGNGADVFEQARNSYHYFLPSLNLKFGLGSDKIIRFAASKVLTRPENDYLRNFLTTSLNSTTGIMEANAGNPFLKPATAWQFDLTGEWYFSRVGSLTVDFFYKDVTNFFYQNVVSRPIVNNGVTESVFVRGPDNFKGHGKIKGFEIAYQQSFDFLPKPLDSLGVNANYTFIKSKGLPNSFLNGASLPGVSTIAPGDLPLEQLSKHNVNVALFYENSLISARVAYNWRSRFLLTASDVIFPYFPIFNEPTGQMDASLMINIGSNLKIGAQGVNLLNEVTKTSQAFTGSPDRLAPRSYFMNDRRFSFILRGSF